MFLIFPPKAFNPRALNLSLVRHPAQAKDSSEDHQDQAEVAYHGWIIKEAAVHIVIPAVKAGTTFIEAGAGVTSVTRYLNLSIGETKLLY